VTRGLLSMAFVALVLAGCGDGASDKAGGSDRKATVLRMANGNGSPFELQVFADEVARRSDGALRIEFANRWRAGQRNYEVGLIRDVSAGKVELGAAGSRSWGAVGVKTFAALHAPFSIDSYALQQDVLESRIPEEMLDGLAPLGLVGLGVLPGPLLRPLSAKRALRVPADFAGLRVGYQGAGEVTDALRALGAVPVQIPASAPWRGFDTIVQQVASINLRAYDRFAKYLTANLALWPRASVIFISKKTFASLSSSQRTLLRDAAGKALPATLADAQKQERAALAALCRRQIDVVSASPADIARLRAAVAPVLDALRSNPQTRTFMASIEAMRQQRGAQADPAPSCPGQRRSPASGIPDGTYTTTITREDVRRSGLRGEDDAAAQFMLVLKAGSFVLYRIEPDGGREIGIEGTYSLYRDRFVGTGNNGDVLRARWSVDGVDLRFTEFEPKDTPYSLVWGTHPWKRRAASRPQDQG